MFKRFVEKDNQVGKKIFVPLISIKAGFFIELITECESTHFSAIHYDRRSSKVLIEFVTPCLEIKIVLARLQPRLTDRFSH